MTWHSITCRLYAPRLAVAAVVAVLVCGAVDPRLASSADTDETKADTAAVTEPALTDEDRGHWAFQPLRCPVPPDVKDAAWPRTPLDRFILAQLEQAGLSPRPPATRTALIRRLTFDLTGLPPDPEDVRRFLADSAVGAEERLIDRLLASPAYGERWARHWLDLARFAETDGFEHDFVRPNAWRYRDWVIDALNADLPFDEFVRRQLAGDLLTPDDPSAAIATGFLLCGPDMPDINNQDERRHTILNEMTATVGSVFLGLQTGCAQCHDHKYDPFSQADFYRFRAFFESADLFRDHPVPEPATLAEHRALEAARGPLARKLDQQRRELEDAARQRLRDKNPDLQPTQDQLLAALTPSETRERADLLKQLERLGTLPGLPLGRVLREGAARNTHLMIRGDFRRPGAELNAAFPRVVDGGHQPSQDERRRLRIALGEWLTRPDHPLTGRVLVNRLWQVHFGEGLVRTPSDFGIVGDLPANAALLDWLACELPRQGGSLKKMHKLLLSSATYQQSSLPGADVGDTGQGDTGLADAPTGNWRRTLQVDPENRWMSRMRRRRLDGEEIRDAMLVASGRLSQRRGGPGVRPPVPSELVATLLKDQWSVSPDPADHRRRSIYLFVRRNLRYPLFDAFDRPDTNASCPRRHESTIAPQALMLLNSEFSLSAARDLCGFLIDQAGTDADAQISLAYRRTLGRPPQDDELRLAHAFLTSQADRLKQESRATAELALPDPLPATADPYAAAALTDFCLALFNLNEFVYVD